MDKMLSGKKVAILLSRGFMEQDVTETQRALLELGASVRIVSPDQGIVSGWTGSDWGHHFAVDMPLNTALGSDYDMLVVPGGMRSLDKLKLTAHTKRFIESFIASNKPAAIMGDAVLLLAYMDLVSGHAVTGPDDVREQTEQAGAFWKSGTIHFDNAMMTGVCNKETRSDFITRMLDLFSDSVTMDVDQAA